MAVNAPEAGTIKELLVSEGDTVTVGQDLAKLGPGEGSGGGEKEAPIPAKEPASDEQPTSSDPEPRKEDKAPPKEEKKPPPPPPEKKSAPSKEDDKKLEPASFAGGSRIENRVG